jgi:hypothetical protein
MGLPRKRDEERKIGKEYSIRGKSSKAEIACKPISR